MISAKITKGADLDKRFKQAILNMNSAVQKAVMRLALKMTTLVKGEKLSGQVLNVRTGRLRRSIHPEWDFKPGYAGATVGTNVEYAAIHEYGLTETKFRQNGGSHTVTYKERSFLRSALREMTPEIKEELRKAVREELERAKR